MARAALCKRDVMRSALSSGGGNAASRGACRGRSRSWPANRAPEPGRAAPPRRRRASARYSAGGEAVRIQERDVGELAAGEARGGRTEEQFIGSTAGGAAAPVVNFKGARPSLRHCYSQIAGCWHCAQVDFRRGRHDR